MISPDFEFKEFMSAIEELDYQQIIDTASHECGEVDRASAAHVRGGARLEQEADKYHQELKNFLHFLPWVGQNSQPLHEPERSLLENLIQNRRNDEKVRVSRSGAAFSFSRDHYLTLSSGATSVQSSWLSGRDEVEIRSLGVGSLIKVIIYLTNQGAHANLFSL